jgi:predicted solute-binding protein
MIDFIQKQLEASEKLYEMMRQDHKERVHQAFIWADINESLTKKLAERDAEIERLRKLLAAYQTVEKL